jgi:hypothetical protein
MAIRTTQFGGLSPAPPWIHRPARDFTLLARLRDRPFGAPTGETKCSPARAAIGGSSRADRLDDGRHAGRPLPAERACRASLGLWTVLGRERELPLFRDGTWIAPPERPSRRRQDERPVNRAASQRSGAARVRGMASGETRRAEVSEDVGELRDGSEAHFAEIGTGRSQLARQRRDRAGAPDRG